MYWLRKIILGLVLLAVIIYILKNIEFLKTLSDEWSMSTTVEDVVTAAKKEPVITEIIPEVKPKVRIITKKKTNAAADGLSKFYASINPDMSGKGPKIRKGVVYLPDPKDNLVNILEARLRVVQPLNKNWHGSVVSRPFRKGSTLFQQLSENAAKDKLEVLWWINRDLVINDPFRIKKDILKTSYQLGEAMEGHFYNGVSTYFCHRHKAIVIIEDTDKYLDEKCRLLTSENGY